MALLHIELSENVIWNFGSDIFFRKVPQVLATSPTGMFLMINMCVQHLVDGRGYHPKERGRSYVTCLAATILSDTTIQLLDYGFEMDVHSTPQVGLRTILSIRNPNHQSYPFHLEVTPSGWWFADIDGIRDGFSCFQPK